MKKLLVFVISIASLLAMISVVGAQDTTTTPSPPISTVGALTPIRTVIQIVADETGFKAGEITRQLAQGMTLADIIQANNGDVQTVIDQSVTKITAEINQAVANGTMTQDRANQLLANLKDEVTKGVNGDLFPNQLNGTAVRRASQRILLQATADATKLSPADIIKQLQSGKTLADIITTNGGTVENVVNAAVAKATADINTAVKAGRLGQAQADTLIANLQKTFTAAIHDEYRRRAVTAIVTVAVLRFAAEQTGLTVPNIVKEIRSGKSLSGVLKEHNIDPASFINSAVNATKKRLDQAVTNGRLTQADADKRLEEFQERLTEQIDKAGGIAATSEVSTSA